MNPGPKILAFAGSTRQDSFNKKVIRIAAEGAEKAGASVTVIDLKDFPLPLFDQDLEVSKGMPEEAKKLRKILLQHDGFMIASPEYNSSITGVLKNAIDWTSRAEKGGGSLDCYTGKTAVLMSASPGGLGGLRGLVHLRAILGNIGVLVLPEQIAVSKADTAFAENGSLKDEKLQHSIQGLGEKLAGILKKLRA
jgi:chromate reductase, NAD(P)H dehydrogenase (quinone)